MIPLDPVSSLINCLSDNEDIRQDLWVSYLSGTPLSSLNASLVRIKAEHNETVELQKAVWQLINEPPSEELQILIANNFSDYERSIICCLMLGLDVSQISDIKGISQVRIKQSIATIRYNSIWSTHGTEKELNGR